MRSRVQYGDGRRGLISGLWPILLIALCATAPTGCQRRAETPPDVAQAYAELTKSLDSGAPGASFVKIAEFGRVNSGYAIADTVDRDLQTWRGRLDAAYLSGRDLVREQRFDEAEAVLTDLARVPNEKSGKLAKEFLAFEFPQMKATRLLQQGDTDGAQRVLRELTKHDLTADQMTAAQRNLDATSTVGFAATMVRTTAMKSAAHVVQVFLYSSYVDNGRYPATISLDSPELASLRSSGTLDVVGSIDDYRATTDTFSLILTGKDPRQRIRITHEGIQEVP